MALRRGIRAIARSLTGQQPGHVAVGVRGRSIHGNPTHAVEVVANDPRCGSP
jgi:hypothetical protein